MKSGTSRPNFVFFMPDQLRAESVGCYGHPVVSTPNLDRLAREGARFDQCHMQFPLCSPSRCSLMTGWYPHVRGHRSLWHLLRPGEPSLFRYLKRGGYDIVWYGKNDLYAPESFATVDRFRGPGGGAGAPNAFAFGDVRYYAYLHAPLSCGPHETADMRRVRKGIEFVRSRRPDDPPFMLYLPLGLPHPPYTAPEPFYSMVHPDNVPPLRSSEFADKPDFFSEIRRRRGLDPLPEAFFRKINAVYLGMVSYVDSMLGELLTALDETGLTEETAVFVFADHGDFAGDWGLVEKWHNALNDPMTRVPLLIRAPGGIPNHAVAEPVELFDVMATTLDLAGIEAQHTHFAQSLVPQLGGAAGDPSRAVFAEGGFGLHEPHCFEGYSSAWTAGRSPQPQQPESFYWIQSRMHQEVPQTVCRATMIRTMDWKLIRRPAGVSELYDLRKDPRELVNLHNDPRHAGARRALEQRMLDWYVQTSDVTPLEEDPRGMPPSDALPRERNADAAPTVAACGSIAGAS
ncbi:MAG: sulfatase-like hydrolase/transferase [Kiritimatiellae bacterium]|nr:sulfatase-like hydrolase/transferase [Kiritimatiellia bacterium]